MRSPARRRLWLGQTSCQATAAAPVAAVSGETHHLPGIEAELVAGCVAEGRARASARTPKCTRAFEKDRGGKRLDHLFPERRRSEHTVRLADAAELTQFLRSSLNSYGDRSYAIVHLHAVVVPYPTVIS